MAFLYECYKIYIISYLTMDVISIKSTSKTPVIMAAIMKITPQQLT